MIPHCSLDTLSSFIDAELDEDELRAVEEHVARCTTCGERASALRNVGGHVRRLEVVAAPQTLGLDIQRRLRLERARVPFSTRIEEELRWTTRQPMLAPLFALVIAFGAILYLFSLGVSSRSGAGTRVVVGGSPAPTVDAVRATEVTGAAASQERLGKVGAPAEEEELRLAGRRFVLRGGVWLEAGVADELPEERILLESGGSLLAGLEALRSHPGTYRLRAEGKVIEIVVPPATGGE